MRDPYASIPMELRLIGASRDGFDMTQIGLTEPEVFEIGDERRRKMREKGWS